MSPSSKMLLVSKSFRSRTERRGIAIVIVMVVVMMVALAAYGFNQQMTDAYRIGSAEIEQTQARLAMSSGIEFALAIAELPRAQREAWLQANPNAFYRVPIDVSNGDDDSEQASWTFSILRSADDQGTGNQGTGTQGTGTPNAEIPFMPGWVDESSKLNFWTLLLQDQQVPGHARKALLNLPGADPADVDAILVPFIRSPGKTSSLEDRLPSRLDPQAQQRRLAILWTGLDWDHNYRIDPLERALASRSSDDSPANHNLANTSDSTLVSTGDALPWRDLVTLASGSRNENRLGQPRIHLNDSNLTRLQRRLDAIWDSERSRFVIAARQYGLQPQPANDTRSSTNAGIAAPPIWTPNLSIPAAHRFDSLLDLVDTVVRIPGDAAQPLVLISPFSSANPNLGNYLEALLDDATLVLGPVLHGQVNVHQAPLTVLLGIPGMSSEMAAKIVRQREQRPVSNTDSHSVGWLLTESVLSLTEMKVILPWINAGGDCFTAQIVGQSDETSSAHRCTVTLDARQRPAIATQVQLWHPWSPFRLPVDLASTSR